MTNKEFTDTIEDCFTFYCTPSAEFLSVLYRRFRHVSAQDFQLATERVIEKFRPTYGCPFPVPADFSEALRLAHAEANTHPDATNTDPGPHPRDERERLLQIFRTWDVELQEDLQSKANAMFRTNSTFSNPTREAHFIGKGIQRILTEGYLCSLIRGEINRQKSTEALQDERGDDLDPMGISQLPKTQKTNSFRDRCLKINLGSEKGENAP